MDKKFPGLLPEDYDMIGSSFSQDRLEKRKNSPERKAFEEWKQDVLNEEWPGVQEVLADRQLKAEKQKRKEIVIAALVFLFIAVSAFLALGYIHR